MNPDRNEAAPTPGPADELLDAALAVCPVIAILRGLPTADAVGVVQALYEAGVRVAEVPLNSPDPFTTIELLTRHFGDRMVIGGGTVVSTAQAKRLASCGARLCVSPNTDSEVIAEARRLGMAAMPGFATPSDAFRALAAGARHLKQFPAAGRTADLKALAAVLPSHAAVTAVGGVTPRDVQEVRAAGARAFGVGSDIYRPGDSADDVGRKALAWVAACARPQATQPRLVCHPHATIGEGPTWRPASERLAWVDPVRRRLLSADRSGALTDLPLEPGVCALATLPSGQLAGILEDGLCIVDESNGQVLRTAAALLAPGCRFNDLCADPAGGLWIGAMHRGLLASRGSLYHAASIDAPLRMVAAGLGIPNGMAYDAQERRLFVIDTLSRNLLAYPVQGPGELGEPVIVTDFMGIPGKPDGMSRAPDGSFWVAMWGGGCVVRIAPDGALLRTVKLPVPHVSSTHVDPQGHVWITTSRMRLSPEQLGDAPLSGALFSLAP